jgi:chaperonin GroEL (HSP60 family)
MNFCGDEIGVEHEDSGGCVQVIPRQLCENAGFDATDVLSKLRQKHGQGVSSIQATFWRGEIEKEFRVITIV